jgi:cation/acetate symporter
VTSLGAPSAVAIACFLAFIVVSLGITWWAARRTRTADHFYAAGRSVTAFQNGLALAGDYMSAASFLGIAGLVALSGFDGLIYSIGFLVGWPIVTFLIAEPLRNLGRYTFADVVAARLRQAPVRIAAAVAFATILAVVAGLTLSGAATLSHDLWVNVVRGAHASEREQLVVARIATIVLAMVSILLGIAFKGQNVAYMVGLAFAIAASANFPALVLSIFWRQLTTAGAQASMIVGTVSTVALIWLSPTIQVEVFGNAEAWFPLRNPGIVTIPLSFAVAVGVSLLRPVASEEQRFIELERRLHLGVE